MNADATTLRQPRPVRRIWVFLLLFLLAVSAAWGVAHLTLRSAAVSYREDRVRALSLQTQQRAAEANVWLSTVHSRVKTLAEMDMLRLFVTESAHAEALAEKLAALARRPEALLAAQLPPEERSMARRFLLVRGQLMEFARQDTFAGARLLSRRLTQLGATVLPPLREEELETVQAELREKAAAVLRDGTPQVLHVRCDTAGRLVLPLLYPVRPPQYMREKDDAPLGVLEIFCDVTETVARMTAVRDTNGLAGRVLQKNAQGRLEEIRVTGVPPRLLPQEWQADAQLEARMRPLPEEGEVFALGTVIAGLPWLAEADMERTFAEAPYRAFRRQVLILTAGGTAIIALLLAVVWWWLVGRHERAVAAEMATLYQLVSRQKELLDGINGALADGLLLRDVRGIVLYVNAAFAAMTGKSVAESVGKPAYQVMNNEAAGQLFQHGSEVIQRNASALFSEEMRLGTEKRQYQVSSAPYHDAAGQVIGVVSVFRDITELVAAQRRAQEMVAHTVRALVRAIEAVDPYLCGQAMRTGALAEVLVHCLGLPQEHADTVRTAANLSQIGMIRLPRALLTKQGALTPEERQELERHVDYAYEALQDIDFGLPVLPAILQMYERLDGSGYPARLRGEQIGTDARILAVAGVFCAMLRPRSYRQACGVQETLQTLSSAQFDPAVTEALRRYLGTPDGKAFLADLTAGRG